MSTRPARPNDAEHRDPMDPIAAEVIARMGIRIMDAANKDDALFQNLLAHVDCAANMSPGPHAQLAANLLNAFVETQGKGKHYLQAACAAAMADREHRELVMAARELETL